MQPKESTFNAAETKIKVPCPPRISRRKYTAAPIGRPPHQLNRPTIFLQEVDFGKFWPKHKKFVLKNDQCDVFQVNNIVYNKPLDVRQLNFTINEQIDAQAILLVHCTLRNICTLKHFLLGICDSKAGSILCSTQKKCDEANLKSRDFYKHSALARSTNAPQLTFFPISDLFDKRAKLFNNTVF